MDWGQSQYRTAGAVALDHLTPYLIIAINCIIAGLARFLVGKLFKYYTCLTTPKDARQKKLRQQQPSYAQSVKAVLNELVSTVELCADCAELNVVHEKHGALVYGLILLVLTYLWSSSFDDAFTSPGYIGEELFQTRKWFQFEGLQNYARLVAQLLGAKFAWRFASFYWSFQLIHEHRHLSNAAECKSSLATSTLVGAIIELVFTMVYRLAELLGHRLLEKRRVRQTTLNWSLSLISTALVLLALEKSGGYFNPVLASSLEFGCKGASYAQHAIVFWLGPMLGHLGARLLFREMLEKPGTSSSSNGRTLTSKPEASGRRLTRSSSQQKKQHTN